MSEPVDHLRDARLHRALAHAPDAQDVPSGVAREAIKKIAIEAINTRLKGVSGSQEIAQAWWQRVWQNIGRQSGPWNAAFATILLGSIITLIWYDKEVPEAALEEKSVVARKEALVLPTVPPAPSAPPASPASPEPPALPAPAASPAALPPELEPFAAPKREVAPAARSSPEAAAKSKAPRESQKAASDSGSAKVLDAELRSAAPVALPPPTPTEKPAQSNSALTDAARSADEMVAADRNERAKSAPEPAAEATLGRSARSMAPPPVPAPAPAPATMAAAPAPESVQRAAPPRGSAQGALQGGSTRTGVFGVGDWTVADLSYQGRSASLARPQAQALVNRALAHGAASSATRVDEPEGAPLLRLQLLDSSGNVAQFELWRAAFKWQRKGEANALGPLTADQVSALLQEAAKLLPP